MGSACSSCSNVMWSGVYIQYFVLYVPRVGYCVCCDISAGLIRPADLYATYYMGLFFDMRVSTSLNPFFSVPLHKPSVYRVSQEEVSVCIQGVPGGSVTILEGHGFGHSKQK